MSNFISLQDYDASIHREILDSLIRDDEAIIEVIEDRAITEMRGYLSARYDCDDMFSREGKERNDLILMLAIDITIYHIFSIHNPQKLSQLRKDRYERAIEYIKHVSQGKANIDGAKLLPKDELEYKSKFLIKSNPKRVNHY